MSAPVWLIEGYNKDHPQWWSAMKPGTRHWTTDAAKAVWFSRKEDADAVIYWVAMEVHWPGLGVQAREHLFVDSRAPEGEARS